MPVAEWLARRIDFKDSMCSLHAALCLRDGLYTPPAPEPGRLRVIWTCTSPSAEWRRLKLWRNFFHRPIQCNHTFRIHLSCTTTSSLFYFQKLTVAEGWTHMSPVVWFSRWLRVFQDLGVISTTSLIFWLQIQSLNSNISSSLLPKSDSWEVADPVSKFIPCDFKASGSVSYLPSYFHCRA